MNKHIALKIIIPVVIAVTMIIVGATYFILKNHAKMLMEKTKTNNMFWGNLITVQLEKSMLSGKRQDVQEMLIAIGKSPDIVNINVIDNEGTIKFSSSPETIGSQITPKENEDIKTLVNNSGYSAFAEQKAIFRFARNFTNHSDCMACHDSSQKILGTLKIDMSLKQIKADLDSNYKTISAFALVSIVFISALLSFLVLYLVNRPISKLISAMDEIERGRLSARAEILNLDEIGILAQHFNSMVESLEKAKKELQSQHEAQLFHMDKLASLGEIALGMAHEIKNPLASIGAAVQVISESGTFDHKHDAIVQEILMQIRRLDKTIKDLLLFARPSEPYFIKAGVTEVINRSILLIKNQAENQRIVIETDFDGPAKEPIMLDPEQLQQVFMNILLNSIQAMPDGGLIRIAAHEAKDGFINITFSDTGKGVTEENSDKIFVPFFTTKPQGTGLGLSIARNIVNKHQGKIFLENRFGTGCTFRILLPGIKNKGGDR
ncbi:MAG: HAMP domain-containing protein [Planctomycetes bacterium]|nr:HAMP domain-containing protein [Planctomycetota bacterium]